MPADLISVDEARSRVLAAVRPLPAESVPVADVLGRLLADDVVSDLELPPFDSSAMDGFAVVAGAGGELPVVGESRAGRPFGDRMQAGQAVRISTGATVPGGADAVVPVERVEDLGERVRVPDTTAGAHIRRSGEDVRHGETLMHAGSELGPAEIGMLAALGRSEVACARRPRVAIVATGDELRPPTEALEHGQIHDSNGPALAALATRAGGEILSKSWMPDEPGLTASNLDRISEGADVLCIAGGVSVGPHDHVKPALLSLGFEELIWGVRLKPGKPFWFGVRDGQYAFGLPGNPVSAMVTFQLFARPALRALQGGDPEATRSSALLDGPIAATPERDQAVRCRLRMGDDGWHAEPTGPQGSHVLSSMIGAAALAIVPASERDLAPGERVTIELL
ncbi:MAG: molybdopterin molybdotransferase [Thermoleophilaceae bacterium]|jgi:molybdopterin molybdotransferase|nr:molybdopterin molybdotransferase [Thermoleophilaceae bacterium]